jgi:NADPH-dependent F420 reductase
MIGFLGGTGPEGRSLALRLAMAGEEVAIGSRDAARAREMAQKVEARGESISVTGGQNTEVVGMSDVIFITVPYEGQAALLESLAPSLACKLIVDTVAPVSFQDGIIRAIDVPAGSAAQEAQSLLPNSQVVAAFQNVSAVDLWVPDRLIEGDVVVCSDHQEAKERVMALAERIPHIRAVDGGALANARYVEEVTAMLLNINRIYKAHTMIRIVGLPEGT